MALVQRRSLGERKELKPQDKLAYFLFCSFFKLATIKWYFGKCLLTDCDETQHYLLMGGGRSEKPSLCLEISPTVGRRSQHTRSRGGLLCGQ